MRFLRWLTGLVDAWLVSFFAGLAVAMLLVKWTWLDMRANPGTIIMVFVVFATLVYILNTIIRIYPKLFWQHRRLSEGLIWGSVLIILATNLFQLDRLAVVPAAVIRDGLLIARPSLHVLNMVVVGGFIVGYVLHILFHRFNRPVSTDTTIQVDRKRKTHIHIVLWTAFLLTAFYFLSTSFQVFMQEASQRIIQGDIEVFRDYLLSFGIWAPIISTLLMIFALVIAPPVPAFVVTFTNGLLFGAFWGTLLSWSSSMLGAAMCFYIARALGRPAVERFFPEKALDWMDRFFQRFGVHSILLARLIPVVSFALVSYGAGLTSMRFWGYFIATGIGQLPATIIYSWLGENASGSVMYIFWAFVVVICLAVLAAAFKPYLDRKLKRGSQA